MGEFEIVTPRIKKNKQGAGKLYTITATPSDLDNPFAGIYFFDGNNSLLDDAIAGNAFRVRIILGNIIFYDPLVYVSDGELFIQSLIQYGKSIVLVTMHDGIYSGTVLNPS